MRKPTLTGPASPSSRRELTVAEASGSLADVIGRVHHGGECFVLTNGGVPVAEICRVGAKRVVTAAVLRKRLASLPRLGVRDATRFAEEIEEARDAVGLAGRSTWN